MATVTLDAMARGGLFDHVAGGFARYSVDATWTVPHFEKMLSDQALLAATYSRAAVWLDEPAYAWVARRTLDFVLATMRVDGGFASGIDADAGGVEGAHVVLTACDGRDRPRGRRARRARRSHDRALLAARRGRPRRRLRPAARRRARTSSGTAEDQVVRDALLHARCARTSARDRRQGAPRVERDARGRPRGGLVAAGRGPLRRRRPSTSSRRCARRTASGGRWRRRSGRRRAAARRAPTSRGSSRRSSAASSSTATSGTSTRRAAWPRTCSTATGTGSARRPSAATPGAASSSPTPRRRGSSCGRRTSSTVRRRRAPRPRRTRSPGSRWRPRADDVLAVAERLVALGEPLLDAQPNAAPTLVAASCLLDDGVEVAVPGPPGPTLAAATACRAAVLRPRLRRRSARAPRRARERGCCYVCRHATCEAPVREPGSVAAALREAATWKAAR